MHCKLANGEEGKFVLANKKEENGEQVGNHAKRNNKE